MHIAIIIEKEDVIFRNKQPTTNRDKKSLLEIAHGIRVLNPFINIFRSVWHTDLPTALIPLSRTFIAVALRTDVNFSLLLLISLDSISFNTVGIVI